MGEAAGNLEFFTFDDYQKWDDDLRWELINGEAFMMSSPLDRHQLVLVELLVQMSPFFKKKPCRVLPAPMDLKLSDFDVLQPDIMVVCRPEQLKGTHVVGAPSLVVEIDSPSTRSRDRKAKLELYARHGVPEYWLVTPYPSMVEALVLDRGRYAIEKTYGRDETLLSATFHGLAIDLASVFDFPLTPEEAEIYAVREPPASYHARVRHSIDIPTEALATPSL